MERRISVKNLYLIGVISLGLIGLGIGSTFAMFTASAEIEDSISIMSSLTYNNDIVDLVDMSISSGSVESATLNITNNTNKTLNYTSWYKTNNNNLQIGTVISNNYSVTGTIEPGDSMQIIVSIRNRGSGVAKVTVGIAASEDNIVVSDKVTTLPTNPLPPYLNDYITSLYTGATKSAVTNNNINYNYATDVNLMNGRLGGTTEDLNGGNIRYYGASPNNYIDIGDRTSNDEVILWRIIGVFDRKVRVVRNESIGDYSYDTSSLSINNGSGINEWSQADLMKLLNPGYGTNKDLDNSGNTITVNNSLYWNSESGVCYVGSENLTSSCDFTSTGLSEVAKERVVSQTLYLGSFATGFADQLYTSERSGNVIQNPSDGVVRTTTWTGKVGLIYPSDYMYTFDFNNTNCQSDISNVCTNNWLSQVSTRMISPDSSSEYGGIGVAISYVYPWSVNYSVGILPTLLLNSNVVLESGTGTSTDPFVID